MAAAGQLHDGPKGFGATGLCVRPEVSQDFDHGGACLSEAVIQVVMTKVGRPASIIVGTAVTGR